MEGAVATAGIAVFAATILLAFQIPDQLKNLLPQKITAKLSALQQIEDPGASQPDVKPEAIDQLDTQVTTDGVTEAEIPVALEPNLPERSTGNGFPKRWPLKLKRKSHRLRKRRWQSIDSDPVLQNGPQAQEAYARMLGDIKLKHNENLSRVIQKVYGRYTSKYFRSLILANPDIDDPDRVEIGQAISFTGRPRQRRRPKKRRSGGFLLHKTTPLKRPMIICGTYPEHAPPASLVPTGPANQEPGLRLF